jgi:hypothetical protein
MKRTWTIIGVGDVPRSFKWYQAPFGQAAALPAHDWAVDRVNALADEWSGLLRRTRAGDEDIH